MENNDWKDELTDDYIHDLEADFEALKQRHKKLVDACKAWREIRERVFSDGYFPDPAEQSQVICDILDEEPISE